MSSYPQNDYMDAGGREPLPLLPTLGTYIHVGNAGAITEAGIQSMVMGSY
ncbi:MAG: hypothetical protein GQ470_04595 [Gammaproteobacteria bacterium]|nr:hypothetical protein [Gammaproteobacteria bacterium]